VSDIVQTLAEALVAQTKTLDDLNLTLKLLASTTNAVRNACVRLEQRLEQIDERLTRVEAHTRIHERPTQPEMSFARFESDYPEKPNE
jgi:hypothetical protein